MTKYNEIKFTLRLLKSAGASKETRRIIVKQLDFYTIIKHFKQ